MRNKFNMQEKDVSNFMKDKIKLKGICRKKVIKWKILEKGKKFSGMGKLLCLKSLNYQKIQLFLLSKKRLCKCSL